MTKSKTLMLEVLRETIDHSNKRIEDLNRRRGYQYLKLVRNLDKEKMKKFLRKLETDLRGQEDLKFQGHCKKWWNLADSQYPKNGYRCDIQLAFPYPYTDDYLCSVASNIQSTRVVLDAERVKFTNDSGKQVPMVCSRLLEKGPEFRAPPVLNKTFLENVELELDKTYI